MNTKTKQHESFPELLGQLAKSSAAVVHDEIELIIQRIREKVTAGSSGVLLVAIGVIGILAALGCLCTGLIIGLSMYMPTAIAALVSGVAFALVGSLIAFIGYRKLKGLISRS